MSREKYFRKEIKFAIEQNAKRTFVHGLYIDEKELVSLNIIKSLIRHLIIDILFAAILIVPLSISWTPPQLQLIIDRPFYYYIRYKKETSIVSLFEGRVNVPEV